MERRASEASELLEQKLEIVLYTTEPCARCIKAKALLTSHGLAYEEINLVKDPIGRRELAERTGHLTFPQIVIAGRILGGFVELEEAAKNGELAALATA
jgi:glutaredoxin 3